MFAMKSSMWFSLTFLIGYCSILNCDENLRNTSIGIQESSTIATTIATLKSDVTGNNNTGDPKDTTEYTIPITNAATTTSKIDTASEQQSVASNTILNISITTSNPITTTVSLNTMAVNSITTTAAPLPSCHRFDGPSFIGGIVLTLGLLAIGLVAYKFYIARNERNYHTL